ISVWNPTFLTLLVARLPDWWPRLAGDIARGTLSPPAPLAPELRVQLAASLRPDPRRAAEVRAACGAGDGPAAVHARLWPRLRLVSCWADAHAALHAPELARLFPQARLQGKGLIATEAFVSLPLTGRPGAALALRSHFFEFLPAGDGAGAESPGERPLLAQQLEAGGRYAVVVTTGGGLYRYRLHDLVEVAGRLGACPLLRFVGREAAVSDRFGEKVHEGHVRRALDALLPRHAIRPAFAMVACEEEAGRHAYTLFVEAREAGDAALLALGADLEAALAENYHYRYCRDLGQLDALRVFRIASDDRGGALETYLAVCRGHGQRAGDVKPVALHRLGGWSRAFRGRLLPAGPPVDQATLSRSE
ncbi:MAG TPA: GH3 auxin-responsive promoter family protein, partial [Vicinamibacteria bacterium]